MPLQLLLARERHEQDRVRRGDADRHDRAHQRGHVQRRAGDEQHRDDAAERRRQRQDHDERIAEVLVVHDHQQIDEDRGEQQPDAEIPERVVHALDLSDHLNRIAGLELLLQLGRDLVDVGRDAAEIAALHAGIDVKDRLDVGSGWSWSATVSRLNVATLLSMPGTVWPLTASEVETGVFASAFSELTLYSGVCTAM